MPVHFDIAHDGVTVRHAEPADAQAVRMLLPDAPDDAKRFVAVDGRHGLVVGAAFTTHAMRKSNRPGPGVAVHVIEPCRRHGVGTKLVRTLIDDATRRGAKALYGVRRVEIDSAVMRGWQWLGFSVNETVEEHELVIADVETRLAPLVERMTSDGRIPSSTRVVPLYTADAQAVARLHQAHMGGDTETLLKRIRGQAPDSFHPRYSLVLTLGGGVVGCLLGHRKSQRAFVIDAVIVERLLRNGWANLLLKLEAARRVKPEGATHIQFTTFDQYVDTRSFTKKLGGVTVRRLALMHRPID